MTIETEQQFNAMKEIGAIVANCLAFLKSIAKPGMTTLELDDAAGKFLAKEGAESAPKTVYNFPGHTCISVERDAAHGIPGERALQVGDLINIDVSAHKNGYFADNGESFIIGKGSKSKTKLCRAVKQALNEAIAAAQADQLISNVGRAVESYASSQKMTVIRNLGGHGVGRSLHETPKFIPSFYDKKDQRVFTANQVVAIEPFLSNGGVEVDQAEDGWTLYLDHHYAAQKEHTIMITKHQPVIFTQQTKHY